MMILLRLAKLCLFSLHLLKPRLYLLLSILLLFQKRRKPQYLFLFVNHHLMIMCKGTLLYALFCCCNKYTPLLLPPLCRLLRLLCNLQHYHNTLKQRYIPLLLGEYQTNENVCLFFYIKSLSPCIYRKYCRLSFQKPPQKPPFPL